MKRLFFLTMLTGGLVSAINCSENQGWWASLQNWLGRTSLKEKEQEQREKTRALLAFEKRKDTAADYVVQLKREEVNANNMVDWYLKNKQIGPEFYANQVRAMGLRKEIKRMEKQMPMSQFEELTVPSKPLSWWNRIFGGSRAQYVAKHQLPATRIPINWSTNRNRPAYATAVEVTNRKQMEREELERQILNQQFEDKRREKFIRVGAGLE